MNKKKTTTIATTPVKESKKTQTLGEFRAWLSGVEEMQTDDWAPDLTQWKRIRERIEDIIESRSFRSDGTGPSDDNEQPVPNYRIPPSSFVAGPAPVVPAALPTFMNTSTVEGAKIKTPNVDTSRGTYASSLE